MQSFHYLIIGFQENERFADIGHLPLPVLTRSSRTTDEGPLMGSTYGESSGWVGSDAGRLLLGEQPGFIQHPELTSNIGSKLHFLIRLR